MNNTSINWTDYSSNLIRARRLDNGKVGHFCTHKNEKCRNCYAEAINKRFGTGLDYKPANREKIEFFFAEKEADNLRRMNKRLAEKGEMKKVFLSSMTDLFHETIPFVLIDEVYAVIAECQNLIFQVLTKRADIALRYFYYLKKNYTDAGSDFSPLPNLWFGLTPEDDGSDIPILLQIPAAVRWLSFEPILKNLDLTFFLSKCAACGAPPAMGSDWRFNGKCWEHYHGYPAGHIEAEFTNELHWIVVGGESGLKARPTYLTNIISIVYQARNLKIPVWVKQLGIIPLMYETYWRVHTPVRLLNPANHKSIPAGYVRLKMSDEKGGNLEDFPEGLKVREFPK